MYTYEFKLKNNWVCKNLSMLQKQILDINSALKIDGVSVSKYDNYVKVDIFSFADIDEETLNQIKLLIENYEDEEEDPLPVPETSDDKISELQNILNALLGVE